MGSIDNNGVGVGVDDGSLVGTCSKRFSFVQKLRTQCWFAVGKTGVSVSVSVLRTRRLSGCKGAVLLRLLLVRETGNNNIILNS